MADAPETLGLQLVTRDVEAITQGRPVSIFISANGVRAGVLVASITFMIGDAAGEVAGQATGITGRLLSELLATGAVYVGGDAAGLAMRTFTTAATSTARHTVRTTSRAGTVAVSAAAGATATLLVTVVEAGTRAAVATYPVVLQYLRRAAAADAESEAPDADGDTWVEIEKDDGGPIQFDGDDDKDDESSKGGKEGKDKEGEGGDLSALLLQQDAAAAVHVPSGGHPSGCKDKTKGKTNTGTGHTGHAVKSKSKGNHVARHGSKGLGTQDSDDDSDATLFSSCSLIT